VPLVFYERTTDISPLSSPLIDQDPKILEPFIKLQAPYEDSIQWVHRAKATYEELISSKSKGKVERLCIELGQV
jgi:hypothetical protein